MSFNIENEERIGYCTCSDSYTREPRRIHKCTGTINYYKWKPGDKRWYRTEEYICNSCGHSFGGQYSNCPSWRCDICGGVWGT